MSTLSICIPTYGREEVLIDSISALLKQDDRADEIVVVDQTPEHTQSVLAALVAWEKAGDIRWLRRNQPSITAAMNAGLLQASGELVLFLDDDIRPAAGLIAAHRRAHATLAAPKLLVAGRVIQPWELDTADASGGPFRFSGTESCWIDEFMGGNFSLRRDEAIAAGGFDENFVRVAYRFEAEFAHRWRQRSGKIRFVSDACLHHLKAPAGGTRTYGDHLTTFRPWHSVGQYYFLLRTRDPGWLVRLALGPFRAVSTRFHLRNPWWVLPVLFGHLTALAIACMLQLRGPRTLGR